MVPERVSIAIALAICIVSGLAWSDRESCAGAAAPKTKIDFDQVFANATRQGEFNPSIHDRLRRVGWNFIMTTTERASKSLAGGYVNRVGKSDRLPNFKSAPAEPA